MTEHERNPGPDGCRACNAETGRCRFQEEIEEQARVRNAELDEEARVNAALAPGPDYFV